MKSITYSIHDRIRVNPFVSDTTQNRGAQKTATIQDVARAARVSTATVSRALSNPDLLSDRTRAAVLDAIRSTGYRVNQAARNLRMQRAGAVLVLAGLGVLYRLALVRRIGGTTGDTAGAGVELAEAALLVWLAW